MDNDRHQEGFLDISRVMTCTRSIEVRIEVLLVMVDVLFQHLPTDFRRTHADPPMEPADAFYRSFEADSHALFFFLITVISLELLRHVS